MIRKATESNISDDAAGRVDALVMRSKALELYKPPFNFHCGYIFDSEGNMFSDMPTDAYVTRVRGWGRIGYMENPEKLQDTVGELIAEALTEFWGKDQPLEVPEWLRNKTNLDNEKKALVFKQHAIPANPINILLTAIFSAETPVGHWMRFPWGTSILGVFRKP